MYKVRPKDPIVRNGVTNGAPIGIAENQWVSLGVSFFPRKSVEFAIIPFITIYNGFWGPPCRVSTKTKKSLGCPAGTIGTHPSVKKNIRFGRTCKSPHPKDPEPSRSKRIFQILKAPIPSQKNRNGSGYFLS